MAIRFEEFTVRGTNADAFARVPTKDLVTALGGPGRGGGTRKLARARSQVSGKTVRTEMRAIQRELRTGKPPANMPAEVRAAGTAAAIVEKLDASRSAVVIGKIPVSYRGKGAKPGGGSEGEREPGVIHSDAWEDGEDSREEAIGALQAPGGPDYEGFAEAFGNSIMDAYGTNGSLSVDDWSGWNVDIY